MYGSTPILILFPLLQQENYDAQNFSCFSHLTFIMLPLYLAKQTPMLVSVQRYIDNSINEWHRRLECVVKNNGGHIEQCNFA